MMTTTEKEAVASVREVAIAAVAAMWTTR